MKIQLKGGHMDGQVVQIDLDNLPPYVETPVFVPVTEIQPEDIRPTGIKIERYYRTHYFSRNDHLIYLHESLR